MNETQLSTVIIEAAMLYGYQVTHFRPAWSERGWRTPVQGHKGFPDLVIAGNGVLLLVELKVGRNTLSPEQQEWRAAIPAENYRLWTDANIAEALSELRTRRPNGTSVFRGARSQPS